MISRFFFEIRVMHPWVDFQVVMWVLGTRFWRRFVGKTPHNSEREKAASKMSGGARWLMESPFIGRYLNQGTGKRYSPI